MVLVISGVIRGAQNVGILVVSFKPVLSQAPKRQFTFHFQAQNTFRFLRYIALSPQMEW